MPAYQNYYPATYQPMNLYQPFQQQMPQIPQMPQIQQPAQQSTQPSPSSILWVGNAQEAQNYPVAPNAAVALWDSSCPVVYLKQADASGKPTLKAFDLVEKSDLAPKTEQKVEYATKGELQALAAAIDAVKGDIKAVRKDMDGAKKTRRREVEEYDDE